MPKQRLEFIELDELDAPLEWWQHVTYVVSIIGAAVALT